MAPPGRRGPEDERTAANVARVIEGDGVSDADFAALADWIDASGAIDESLDAARQFIEHAVDRLNAIDDQLAASQLEAFANLALERTS